jgi:hypothetical protein
MGRIFAGDVGGHGGRIDAQARAAVRIRPMMAAELAAAERTFLS